MSLNRKSIWKTIASISVVLMILTLGVSAASAACPTDDSSEYTYEYITANDCDNTDCTGNCCGDCEEICGQDCTGECCDNIDCTENCCDNCDEVTCEGDCCNNCEDACVQDCIKKCARSCERTTCNK